MSFPAEPASERKQSEWAVIRIGKSASSKVLPDTELGRIVLKLLEKAFNQHLTFTLVTNKGSRDAMVAWNTAIGHKTEFGPSENERYSYPDPAFLEDVARQLARLGISTEIMEDDEETTNV